MEYLVLGLGLIFGLFALRDLLALSAVPNPASLIITFAYSLICAIFLIIKCGLIST